MREQNAGNRAPAPSLRTYLTGAAIVAVLAGGVFAFIGRNGPTSGPLVVLDVGGASTVPVAASAEDLHRFDDLTDSLQPMPGVAMPPGAAIAHPSSVADMVRAGRIFFVPIGTHARVLHERFEESNVSISEGEASGRSGWVSTVHIRQPYLR